MRLLPRPHLHLVGAGAASTSSSIVKVNHRWLVTIVLRQKLGGRDHLRRRVLALKEVNVKVADGLRHGMIVAANALCCALYVPTKKWVKEWQKRKKSRSIPKACFGPSFSWATIVTSSQHHEYSTHTVLEQANDSPLATYSNMLETGLIFLQRQPAS